MLFFLSSLVLALEIGQPAPDFGLKSTKGEEIRLQDNLGKVVVLEWFNPGCPFVKYAHKEALMKSLVEKHSDVVWLGINSSAKKKQGHGAKKNAEAKAKWNLSYPILLDELGLVGKLYNAKTTPHMYIIDAKGTLVYQGAFDSAPMGRKKKENIPYVSNALDEIKAGKEVSTPETKAYGCSVKYAR